MRAIKYGIAAAAALSLVFTVPLASDDTDLMRVNTAQPYVMFLFDVSSSMNLEVGTSNWLPLGGDDPNSRIYAAKKAVYDVINSQSEVNYGLMTYNQDRLRVQAKHWLYVTASDPDTTWPLPYPLPNADAVLDATDDALTLGRHILGGVAGTCTAPLDLSVPVERAKVNRFPKLGEKGTEVTEIWVKPSRNGSTYRLRFSAPEIQAGSAALGAATLTLQVQADQILNCTGSGGGDDDDGHVYPAVTHVAKVVLSVVDDFLMADSGDRFADDGVEGGGNDIEDFAGFWEWSDAMADAVCSDGSPFTGKGLESNYDDPELDRNPPPELSAYDNELTSDDEYCANGATPPCTGARYDLKYRTSLDATLSQFRELDRGDFIPYHWDISAHEDVLRRLNPKHGNAAGEPADFGAASYFADTTDGSGTGYLELRDTNQRPMIAAGQSPFGKTINDYRCWYLGPKIGPAGKCRESGAKIAYEYGWQQIAADPTFGDPDYECRRPYAILITDGEDNCEGENPTADINDFDSFGVQTWVINVGGQAGEKSLRSILSSTKAELITIAPGGGADALAAELRKILGVIESQARSFAAAVPSVQTEDEQKIYLTAFTPLNETSIWAGRALAFLKPLPRRQETDAEGVVQWVPDTTRVCGANDTQECFLWDAGEAMKTQIDTADPFGPLITQRRVFYPGSQVPGSVPMVRRPLQPSGRTGAGDAAEKELWRGLGIPFIEGNLTSEENARAVANDIVDFTYSLKSARLDPNVPGSEIDFVLGDNFHAEPLVVGPPTSNQLFVQNYKDYRDFANKHQYRRKLFALGTNDGMLHFLDAGIAREISGGGAPTRIEYDRGTGKEIAAYVPQAILPTLNAQYTGLSHLWSVDGDMTVADVHIDPKHNGSPADSNREWRTVLVAGLRRGGEAIYALDITQPDPLREVQLTEPVAETVLISDVPDNARLAPCWDGLGSGDLGCDEDLHFLTPLWEFTDTVTAAGVTVRLDEDANGLPDFAQSWSKPNIGRIRVNEGGSAVDKFVAIFGGGIDPDHLNERGNWLYIVDIETGQTIFKQRLVGSMPAEPAAVDTDQDGLLDRVYAGTTGGLLYRLNLGPDTTTGDLPTLSDYSLTVTVNGLPQVIPNQKRIQDRVPYTVFDTIDAANGLRGPIYFRPSVIFAPRLNPSYVIAVGTGDRENLWSRTPATSAFYVFAEDTDQFGGPITMANLETVDPTAVNTNNDYLFNPADSKRHGWYIPLLPGERVVTRAFPLSGITVFSTFIPEVESVDDPTQKSKVLRLCSRKGDSRIFAVMTNNANGVLFDSSSNRTRSLTVNTLVSQAFADLSVTKNQPDPDDPTSPDPTPDDGLTDNLRAVMEDLKKLFPANCRFANYRIDIRAVAADTEVVDIAPVPVCVIEKNWREF